MVIELTKCDDGSCCCFPPRFSVLAISLLSMGAGLIDLLLAEACANPCCPMRNFVETGRVVLLTLFSIANTLLLGAVIIENAFLIKLYIWFTLCFVILGLILAILDLLYRYKEEATISFANFFPEVAFLFVLYRCLPIVDCYRTYLEATATGPYIKQVTTK